MIYLESFELLDDVQEHGVNRADDRNIFTNKYPLGIFPNKQVKNLNFKPITIFYGENGSGKSTILNIIAQSIGSTRLTKLNKGVFFDAYCNACTFILNTKELKHNKIITSDDIFDYLLDIRAINTSVDRKKDDLSEQYLEYKHAGTHEDVLDTYNNLKETVDARRMTMSRYVRERLVSNTIQEQSNGESALMFWEKEITENSIYILDEPENSLSASNQRKLCQFIEDSARFYNCQFIISTHSPFMLSLQHALIYDLDSIPVTTKSWNELENVRAYYELFKEHNSEF